MKFSQSAFLFLISLTILLFPNCNKDDSNNPSDNEVETFSAKFDGSDFNSLTPQALIGTNLIGDEQLSIVGSDPSNGILGVTVLITVPDGETLEDKTYQFFNDCSGSFCGAITFVGNQGVGSTSVENGNFEIYFSTIDFRKGGTCKGTFSGTIIDYDDGSKIYASEGKFNVSIQ